jgi:uncharacterized ferritin-like protein (DUF455 family)
MDWSPFRVAGPGEKAPGARGLHGPHGIADRLRTAAFAERQAFEAFAWAAERFADAPDPLRAAWRRMAVEEKRHMDMLLERMAELGADPAERPVSDRLWRALSACATVPEFVALMREAEARGKAAEDAFRALLIEKDRKTADIFGKIADDEAEHLAFADRLTAGGPRPGGS